MKLKEQPIQPQESEQSQGKMICSYCGKEYGEFKGEGTSHGICTECAKKLKPEMREALKVHAQEVYDIINNPQLLVEEKLKKLRDISNSLFIRKQTELKITEENLDKIAEILQQKFGIEKE